MENPFSYGITAAGKFFTNREEDLEELKTNLINGINTSIISPRRWGKSSLVEKALLELKKETELKIVSIDMFSVNSEHEFYEIFARECIKSSSNLLEEWMKSGIEFFKNIIPKLSVGIDPSNDFSVSFDWEEAKKHHLEILNLPEVIAKKKGVRFVIAIDEFQNITNFHDAENFEKKLRAVWQKQKSVTYCLYGSKRHMMNEIFNSSSKPFYRFGDIKFLQKITAEKWKTFIKAGFKRTKKQIDGSFVNQIIADMNRHSWYVQQFSYFVWVATQDKVTDEIFFNAKRKLVQSNSPFFTNVCENLSPKQINLLKAVVKNEQQITSTAVLKQYDLGTSGTATKNKNTLIEKDILDLEDGNLTLQDPVFELWFRKIYFNENYAK